MTTATPLRPRLLARLKHWLSHDAHPAVQFVKYGMAGVLAVIADQLVFYALGWRWIPAMAEDDIVARLARSVLGWAPVAVEESVRWRNFLVCKSLSFVLSNFVAYLLNVAFVFRSGRHARHREIALFYLVALISFVVGVGLATGLVAFAGMPSTYANVIQVVVAVMINYACRKFWIFHG